MRDCGQTTPNHSEDTMTDFTITCMRIIDAAPNQSGTRVLASYDMIISGLKLGGCILTESPDGIVSAKGILGKASKGDKISAQIVDPALHRAITRRVAQTYSALTGRVVSDE